MKSSTPASEAITEAVSVIPSQHNGTHSHPPQLVKAFTDTGFNNVFEIDNAVDIAIKGDSRGVPQARNPFVSGI